MQDRLDRADRWDGRRRHAQADARAAAGAPDLDFDPAFSKGRWKLSRELRGLRLHLLLAQLAAHRAVSTSTRSDKI